MTIRTVLRMGEPLLLQQAQAVTEFDTPALHALIQDLEDFTPPNLRPHARSLAATLFQQWRDANALVCVRINALEGEGLEDLKMVMPLWYPACQHLSLLRAASTAKT